MRVVRQRMQRVAAIVAVLIALSLIAAQTRAFAEVVSTCCCGHALPCKCPEHQPGAKKKHGAQPTMRPCGSPNQMAVAPELPACDLPPVTVFVPEVTVDAIVVAAPVPAPAPDRTAPPVPI